MLVILLSFLLFTILSDALGVSGNRNEVGILNNMDSNSTVHRKSKDDDTAPTKSCFSGGLKEITIINDINSTELIVHCKSKGADLGVIKLLTSQYFQFESCNQVFGMTLFLLQFCMG
jgi:hypothetical protein